MGLFTRGPGRPMRVTLNSRDMEDMLSGDLPHRARIELVRVLSEAHRVTVWKRLRRAIRAGVRSVKGEGA